MVVTTLMVFVADLITPLGITVWVFYLVPVFLSLFLWRPAVPLICAAAITALFVGGYFFSPPGAGPFVGRVNRAFGIVTIWIVSEIAHRFILNKLLVRKEEWLQAGQTGLSERLRGEQSLQQIGDNTLRFLAEYLQAQLGVLYARQGELFRRSGAYALPATGVPEQIHPREGIVGQLARDARALILTDVPEDYFHLGSALGHSRPRHLIVCPLTADAEVIAILELGFIHPIDSAKVEFLDRVSESIGIAVRTAKARERVQQLLEETQRQTEELQVQGEELRVSNEELAEQSRALKESQSRLELQQAELEQTNQQLEEQAKALEMQTEDLTSAKADLESQTRSLEQASRYKSDFLASMSHELRTPLNSSLILARLLTENRSGNLTPEQIKYAQTIESAGNELLALITDILDLSKIEAGRMEVRLEQIPVGRLIENLTQSFKALADDKRLEFQILASPEVPAMIETDAQKLHQVLKNVLSNAIKFTERGKVQMTIRPAEPGWISFVVTDTGIGIPPEHQALIFEPFRQVDDVSHRKSGGTGLGLSISRDLVTLLGGRIELESTPLRGSTFTITLPEQFGAVHPKRSPTPLSPPQSVAPAPTDGQQLSAPLSAAVSPLHGFVLEDDRQSLTRGRQTVLIVEDDPTFARILCDLAHELGFQCLLATHADQAVSLARQYSPSAVLLDIGLPDNSGLTVLDRLKRLPATRHLPVHVISAGDYSEIARDMGAIGYMLKPVKRDQLVEAFTQLQTRIKNKVQRILIVEDDPVQLDSLQRLLQTGSVETLGVRTSAECLELLKSNTVDCMVLDLNLPDGSGFTLIETLAREEAYSFPPVIIYTGRDLNTAEEQRLRRYSKSIIIKGAKSPERLLDEVTLFLHQVISELPPEKQKLLEKASRRDAALEDRRILIVEDDVRSVFALTGVLEPRGALIDVARNGKEALQALHDAGNDPAKAVHLVFMDIMMPEMDGLTAIREIRRRPEWKKLPIIALTAKAMKADQHACLQAGANDYMSKPIDVEKLLSLARVWICR